MSDILTTTNIIGFEKIVKMHEALKGNSLTFSIGNRNSIEYLGMKMGRPYFHITITDTKDEGVIEQYIALKHELFHYLFDSKISEARTLSDVLSLGLDNKPDLALGNYIHGICNFLEDNRIESLGGKLFIGDRIGLDKVKHALGLKMSSANDPMNALQASRFFRDDLLVNNEFAIAKQYMEDIKYTSADATCILAKKYVEEIVMPWWIKKHTPDPPPKGGTGGGTEGGTEGGMESGEGGEGGEGGDPVPNEDGEPIELEIWDANKEYEIGTHVNYYGDEYKCLT